MVADKNGMEHIYPGLANGFSFSMNNNDADDSKFFQVGGSVDKFISKGGGWWTVDDPDKVRLSFKKFPEAEDSIDGCDLDFAETDKRGYAYKKGDLRDVEVKMLLDVRSLDEHVLIGGPTGHHPSDSSPCCQGASYFARFQNKSTFSVQIGKEMFHHDGYESLDEKQNSAVRSTGLDNGIIGVGYIRYNRTNNGRREVVIESWIDANGDGKGWKKFSSEVDYIGRKWYKEGRDGTECGGAKDQPIFWGNLRVRVRWDDKNSDVRFKSACIREIAPGAPITQPGGETGGGGGTTTGGGGGGTSTGTPVPTELVQGFRRIKFRRSINYYAGNFCATASTTDKLVYNQTTSNGAPGTELNINGAMTGEVVKDRDSVLWGVAIKSGTVYLTKIGSGTNVDIKIKDSSNRQKALLATITAASINTTETTLPFSSPSNTYRMKTGDRFVIEEAGSPSESNCIAVSRHDAVVYNSIQTKRLNLIYGR
jgi:hypothetical protein